MEIKDQPNPQNTNDRVLWLEVVQQMNKELPADKVTGLVITDALERHQTGVERYGVPLCPHNGRNALVDAYQELLDASVYLWQEFVETGDASVESSFLHVIWLAHSVRKAIKSKS